MADSIRERAIKALVASLEDQRDGLPTTPAGDAFDFRWKRVVRYPLSDTDKFQDYTIAVLEGDETKRAKFPCTVAFLQVELEFRTLVNAQDEPAECLNNTLMNIQRNIRQDITLGGLVINVRETGNSTQVQSIEDRQIGGSVFLEIEYIHAEDDPREIRPGVIP